VGNGGGIGLKGNLPKISLIGKFTERKGDTYIKNGELSEKSGKLVDMVLGILSRFDKGRKVVRKAALLGLKEKGRGNMNEE